MLFADVDFTGLELCTVAQACLDTVGESALGEAINAGADVHLMFGASLLGISYEEAVRRKREPEVKDARQIGKVGNFGFPGGLGAKGFVKFARKGYGLKLEESFAKDLKRQWLNQWPEFHGYFKFVAGICSEGTGDVEQLRVGRVRGRCTYTQACNTFFQGLGADGAKRALWAATRAMYAEPESPLYGCRAPLFVHDQVVAEVPEEPRAADAAARELARVMCDACNELLPDVPVKATPCLTKHWHKDAEQVLDEEGLIIPWDLARENRTKCWYPDGKQVEW